MARVWYTNPDRTAVVWGTAVVSGKAATDIYKLTDTPGTDNDQFGKWRETGQVVTAAEVAAAQAEASADAIPVQSKPNPTGGTKFTGRTRPATPAAADLATAITLANALRDDLIALGLKAP